MHQLTFPPRHRFTRTKNGITIPLILSRGARFEKAEAKIETGAEFCLFRREIGEALELPVRGFQGRAT
ncbi:MAG: hypothetical protein ACKV2V_27270 [Blastocatellia bacterium]